MRSLTISRRTVALWVLVVSLAGAQGASTAEWLEPWREPASRLINEAMRDDFAWQRLAYLTDTFGHRLSGSAALERALEWAADEMRKDGLENVRAEPVMVPHWVRGRESAEIVAPGPHAMAMLGLGGSVATPPEGIQAEALVVGSFDELDRRAADAKRRIVVYNVAYTTYGQTVQYRANGASRAARHGAVAALVRAVGPAGLRTPHTGGMRYEAGAPKIPAAAISAEDAARLQRLHDRGQRPIVRLTMEAQFLPDAPSANVMGEVIGRERPAEVVVVGCHIDSWDVGTGASDDAGGCIVTWDALRIVRKLGLRPRRTLRVVLFTNEENGVAGGNAYRDRHRAELKDHVMMLESDGGIFHPDGFGFTGSDAARARVTDIASLLAKLNLSRVGASGGGVDIGPSVEAGGMPSMSLAADVARYFVIHHTPADTVDQISRDDVSRGVAAVAVMAYVVADMPERLDGLKN
jgi:carboxypeptidase Q